MARLSKWLRIAALTGTAALAVASSQHVAAGAPEPVYAKAKADSCVRDTAFMIRHHPGLLKHQRDDTMRRGIRAGEYSLKRCMECHTNDGANHASIKTDCDSCHAYAAVKLDCWDCHSKKAAPNKAAPPSPMMTSVQTEGQTQ